MKYVKNLTRFALLATLLTLFGCATSGSKVKLVTDAEKQPDLLSTLEYIPKQKTDTDGLLLPYEARENPYAAQRGRVKKESILGFIEARRAYKAGNYDKAQELLAALAQQDASLSGPWVMLGDIAMESNQYSDAVNHYIKAIEINRLNVNAYLRLAKAQRIQGQFLHAQNTYAKVLSIWPDFPEAHLNLAILYDVYLNHPLRAQKHMESYQFLKSADNEQVASWLDEIRQRTGVAPNFENGPSDSLTYNQ